MKRGKLITFEGGEGAGKTTLIEKVFSELSSRHLSVIKTRAPGGTKAGEEIRSLLLHKKELKLHPRSELLLFLADRAQHVEEVILPALHAGKMVLCDRFNDSTIAYQGGARGLDREKVKELCFLAAGGLTPDLTLYLDLDPRIGLQRAYTASQSTANQGTANQGTANQGLDKIEQEGAAFHQKIREAFLLIAKEDKGRFMCLDASLSPEKVFEEAMKYVDRLS